MKSLAYLLLFGTACWLFLIPVNGWVFPKMITKHCNDSFVEGYLVTHCYRYGDADRWYANSRSCPKPRKGSLFEGKRSWWWGEPDSMSAYQLDAGLGYCIAQFKYQCLDGPDPGPPPECQLYCRNKQPRPLAL